MNDYTQYAEKPIKKDAGGTKHVQLTDEEIKPCPFCGSDDIELCNTHTAAYWMECQECSAQVDGKSYEGASGKEEENHLMSAESAVQKWNCRA